MNETGKKNDITQYGAYMIIIAFSIFIYADINIYYYSKIIVLMRVIIILLFCLYLVISKIKRFKSSKYLRRLYLFNTITVFIFMDVLLMFNSYVSPDYFDRAIQVAMAINLGIVIFSDHFRRNITVIILLNTFVVLLIQMTSWQSILPVFYNYFNLLMFNIGLYFFNWNYCNLMSIKESLSEALKNKVAELETELAIEEMLELELTQKAHYDGMTKFLNRSAGSRVLSGLFLDSKNNKYPLALCYLDLNDLKKVNDRWGHEAGDQYILDFVEIIKLTIRNDDRCVRMGGDEFLLIFSNVTYDIAETIWKKIQSNIETYGKDNKRNYDLSVSHGIAERIKSEAASFEELIDIADQRMFDEKRRIKKEKVEV